MARVSRLAGALLAESNGYYLVGNTKRPCDFAACGFEPPQKIDALVRPYLTLVKRGQVEMETPFLELDVEGEALPKLLYELFIIPRNGSVSDRLWRLVAGMRDEDSDSLEAEVQSGAMDVRWLGTIPKAVWDVVRDSVLRCT